MVEDEVGMPCGATAVSVPSNWVTHVTSWYARSSQQSWPNCSSVTGSHQLGPERTGR